MQVSEGVEAGARKAELVQGRLGYVTLFLFVGFTRFQPDAVLWLVSEVLMLRLGILSAMALKSPSRPLTLFSGLLLILLLSVSVNV
ncbi:MAG TPA: hypothetical protein VHM93_00960 [Candidatus Acidoferrum sp.]|jgi:hypothetical protein|nr:hypothetical protein [Candidatus Acidoferrum sp.]